MNRRFRAEFTAQKLNGAVADHLVDIHVGLGAGAGLPHVEREMLVQLPADHLVTDFLDDVGLPLRQPPRASVDVSGSLLDVSVGVVDILRHAVIADGEVNQRSRGLRAPVAVGLDVDLPHRVVPSTVEGVLDSNRYVSDLWWRHSNTPS